MNTTVDLGALGRINLGGLNIGADGAIALNENGYRGNFNGRHFAKNVVLTLDVGDI